MSRCKPGDMAWIVEDETILESMNHGMLVEVLDDSVMHEGRLHWRVRSNGRLMAWVDFEGGSFGGFSRECYHQDAWLRPQRPEPGRDETAGWERPAESSGEHPKRQVEFAR